MPGAGSRRDQHVLVVVVGPEVDRIEAGVAEQAAERARAEVRAVLVVDVPEGPQVQNPGDLGDHEEDQGVAVLAQGRADAADERRGVVHMLERHLAAQEIRAQVAVARAVEVLDERGVADGALLPDHLIEAVAAVVAEVGEHGDELALAAAELDHDLAVEIEPLDELLGKPIVEAIEGRRHRLGRLVVVLVLHQAGSNAAFQTKPHP